MNIFEETPPLPSVETPSSPDALMRVKGTAPENSGPDMNLMTVQGSPAPAVADHPISIFEEHPTIESLMPQDDLPDGLYKAIQNSPDPMNEWAKIRSSIAMGKVLGVSPGTVYENHEAYTSAWLGTDRPAKGAGQAIADAWNASVIQSKIADTWSNAIMGGDFSEATKEVEHLRASMPSQGVIEGGWPVKWATDAATFIAQQAYITEQAARSKTMSKIAGGTTGILLASSLSTGPAAPITAAAIGTGLLVAGMRATTAIEGGKLEMGGAFEQMIQAGVDPETAAKFSAGVGAINTVIESFQLSAIAKRIPGLKNFFGEAMTEQFIEKFVKGKFVDAAQKVVGKTVARGAGALAAGAVDLAAASSYEAGTEAIQQLVGDMAQNAAAAATNKANAKQLLAGGTPASTMDQEAIRQDMVNTFMQMWRGNFLTMGIVKGIGGSVNVLREHQAKRLGVPTSTETASTAATLGGTPEDLADESANPALAKRADGTVDPAHAYRDIDSGRLYSETSTISSTSDQEGQSRTDAVLKVGNPETGELYGYIRHEIEGDKLIVRDIDFDRPDPSQAEASLEGHEPVSSAIDETARDDLPASMKPLFKEAFTELMAKYPGMTIEWSPSRPGEIALRDELVAENPRGEAYGLQWFDSEGTAKHAQTLEDLRRKLYGDRRALHLEKPGQVDAAVKVVDSLARSIGLTGDEYLGAAYKEGVYDRSVSGLARQDVRGGISFEQLGGFTKSLIHLSEHADISTWVHENIHGYVNFLRSNQGRSDAVDTRLGEIEKVFGVEGGNWDAVASKWTDSYKSFAADRGIDLSNNEVVAYAVEDFLRTGKAPADAESRTLIQKLAAWLADIYKAIRGMRVQLSPEINDLFTRLLGDQESPLSQAVKASETTPKSSAQPKKAGRQEGQAEKAGESVASSPPDALAGQEEAKAAGSEQYEPSLGDAFPEDHHDRLARLEAMEALVLDDRPVGGTSETEYASLIGAKIIGK